VGPRGSWLAAVCPAHCSVHRSCNPASAEGQPRPALPCPRPPPQIHTRKDAKYSLKASYVEIYNEGVYDLIHFQQKTLPVKWDATYGFYVQGLKVVPCGQARTMMEVIRTGMKHRRAPLGRGGQGTSRAGTLPLAAASQDSAWGRPAVCRLPVLSARPLPPALPPVRRRVGSHQLNMESSRSHSIMTVYCDATPTGGGGGMAQARGGRAGKVRACARLRCGPPCGPQLLPRTRHAPAAHADPTSYDYGTVRYGKLSFVDLAGSERVKDSKSEGVMLKETININKSLSVLGKVRPRRRRPCLLTAAAHGLLHPLACRATPRLPPAMQCPQLPAGVPSASPPLGLAPDSARPPASPPARSSPRWRRTTPLARPRTCRTATRSSPSC
jgi:hypothetical protein